ncbi:MAG: metallophosphoesterase [Phycisphaerales bacterium]|nr:metallophosphoesterase [Phycisphaerales bacterium]
MRTIAHVSDLHFGRLDAPVAERLVEDLRQQTPSLLVVSGDFTQRARRRQYAQAAAFLKRLPTPQILVPGNHDVPMYDVIRRFLLPLQRYQAYITPDLFPSYLDDEMFVLGINTARSFTQKSGWITEDQLAIVEQKMQAQAPGLMRVLVTHHPFIPPPRDPHGDILRGAAGALARLEQCGVDLLLAGHLHLAYHDDVRSRHKATRRSILSIQAGTATSTRRRGEPNAYNWITLSPDLVTVAVRAWDGREFTESLVTRYRRTDHIWSRESQLPVDTTVPRSPEKNQN